jgi:hypothetical protein
VSHGARLALSRRPVLVAALLYLGVALWALRVIVPGPTRLLPYSRHLTGPALAIDHTDQRFVVASIMRTALAFTTLPWQLFETGECYPMHNAATLGEHMFGEALLGAVPARILHDPIATYNIVLLLTLWIPGLTMYALVREWTGSELAALTAGFLFAFEPGRIGDPVHPFVHGDLWFPLVFLFAHRLSERGRWRDALGLALALALQLLESFYMLFALALLGAVYGPYLLARTWRRLPVLLPRLAFVCAAVGGIALVLFQPYVRTRAAWGVLEGRGSLLLPAGLFLPGQFYYPGTVTLVLAALGMLDRLRGARPVDDSDPRAALCLAGCFVFWTVVWGIWIPGVGFVNSPYHLMLRWIPGLSAVRAVPAARTGVYFVLAVLAGYGVLTLIERLGWRRRGAVGGVLLVLAAVEVFWSPAADWTLGHSPVELGALEGRPPAELLALLRTLPPGAVLDVPFPTSGVARNVGMSHDLLLAAYHRSPVAACYNSFFTPMFEDVAALAAALPDPNAVEALHALGFGSVVLHEEWTPVSLRAERRAALAATLRTGARLIPVEAAAQHVLYRIESDAPVEASFAALRAAAAPADEVLVTAPVSEVEFRFENAAPGAYRHPDPIEPTPLRVRWYDGTGKLVAAGEARALLPIALGHGAAATRRIQLEIPAAPGHYEVSLAVAARPDLVVARRRVVVPGSSGRSS